MIAAVSPSALAYEDTYNTLKYADRAKEIKLSVSTCLASVGQAEVIVDRGEWGLRAPD